MTDSKNKDKNLTLKGLKKETDAWMAEKDGEFEFMNERVTDLDDCMDEVVQTLDKMEKDIKTHSDGIREISNDIGSICSAKVASEKDMEEMQRKMDEVFKKMTRVEKAQARTEGAYLDLLQDTVDTADKVTYLKEESHRITTLLGVVAAAGLGLGLVMTALYMGLV